MVTEAKIASINEALNDRQLIIRMHGSNALCSVRAISCISDFLDFDVFMGQHH